MVLPERKSRVPQQILQARSQRALRQPGARADRPSSRRRHRAAEPDDPLRIDAAEDHLQRRSRRGAARLLDLRARRDPARDLASAARAPLKTCNPHPTRRTMRALSTLLLLSSVLLASAPALARMGGGENYGGSSSSSSSFDSSSTSGAVGELAPETFFAV